MFLPYLGSGLVPPHTMPAGIRQFAEYQPFSPIANALRGLMLGTPIGHDGPIAVAWCVGIAAVGYFWSMATFRK
jgi:ABC-2 type transport system permease protein